MDLRCNAKLHGVVYDNGVIEIKCQSRFCGAESGVVVIHKFDLHTGGMETVKYKEPPTPKKRGANGDCGNVTAIRTA